MQSPSLTKKGHSELPSGIAAIIQVEGGGYATSVGSYGLLELPAELLMTRAGVSSLSEVSISDIWQYMFNAVVHSTSTFLLIIETQVSCPVPNGASSAWSRYFRLSSSASDSFVPVRLFTFSCSFERLPPSEKQDRWPPNELGIGILTNVSLTIQGILDKIGQHTKMVGWRQVPALEIASVQFMRFSILSSLFHWPWLPRSKCLCTSPGSKCVPLPC